MMKEAVTKVIDTLTPEDFKKRSYCSERFESIYSPSSFGQKVGKTRSSILLVQPV